ncbi:hypothetical protein HPB47_007329 [Ixodes persulcatus]|uniref:Uncharacterized protein n=1 Tax=Ixodes persulcatus TaxID=34615 RepID=A0AC60P811_IXOPE|nr:hypothetical protein HPB47_007329 [Ixodes persulcatus]
MSTPTKAQCFSFNVPAVTPVDAIMDSIQAVASSWWRSEPWPQLNKSPWSQWEPTLFLAEYGKVKAINHAMFRDRPGVRTGTRVIKMKMSKPVPKFVHIQRHQVMVDYRGLRRVCSRCGLEGHIGPACKTPRCDRCGVFEHATAGCTVPCQWCGHGHATTDWVQRRLAHALRSELSHPSPSQPASILVTTRTRTSARGLHDLPLFSQTPTFRRTWELPTAELRGASHVLSNAAAPTDGQTSNIPWNGAAIPGSQASRVPSNKAATFDSQTSDAWSNAAATLGSRGTDVDDLNDDFDRLFITEEGDVTPGQGHPPSTPEASTTTTPRELSVESESPEDADMPDERLDAKRVFSPAGGGSDATPASLVKKKRLSTDNFDYAESLEF